MVWGEERGKRFTNRRANQLPKEALKRSVKKKMSRAIKNAQSILRLARFQSREPISTSLVICILHLEPMGELLCLDWRGRT